MNPRFWLAAHDPLWAITLYSTPIAALAFLEEHHQEYPALHTGHAREKLRSAALSSALRPEVFDLLYRIGVDTDHANLLANLARNPYTPPPILHALAQYDGDPHRSYADQKAPPYAVAEIREQLAQNPSSWQRTLTRLSTKLNLQIAGHLADNPRMPKQALQSILRFTREVYPEPNTYRRAAQALLDRFGETAPPSP